MRGGVALALDARPSRVGRRRACPGRDAAGPGAGGGRPLCAHGRGRGARAGARAEPLVQARPAAARPRRHRVHGPAGAGDGGSGRSPASSGAGRGWALPRFTPNAAVVLADAPSSRDVLVVELSRPRLGAGGRTLAFRAEVLRGNPRGRLRGFARSADRRIAARFGRVSLFIDPGGQEVSLRFSVLEYSAGRLRVNRLRRRERQPHRPDRPGR